ncbi:MAG: glycosyltransferase, partial [Candidatus Omnitrophica bacterium]|nr:glycosyltransferase [Candidatus Omnitrophota bacterium]
MNKKPFISIIVAHHNNKTLIRTCLDALFKIDYPKDRFEVIVIDNASRDGSAQFIKKHYKKVTLIKNPSNNYCRGCNLGITKAKGEYSVLLNNDVVVQKNWLSPLVAAMQRNKSIGAVTSKLLNADGTIQNVGLYALPHFYWDERGAGKSAKEFNVPQEVDAISGACVMYRRAALDRIGLLDEDFVMFGEDVDMSLRLKEKGLKLKYIPSSVGVHKKHGSCNEDFAREAIEKNRLLLVAKHYPKNLAVELIGSDYFVARADRPEMGRFFDIIPNTLLKLTKQHTRETVNTVIQDMFVELKKIVNYENRKLQEDLKNILNDLIGTRKERDYHKIEEQRLSKESEEKNKNVFEKDKRIEDLSRQLATLEQEAARYKAESVGFSGKLLESLNASLVKDESLREKQQNIEQLSRQLDELCSKISLQKDEIASLANKVQEKINAQI